MVHATATTLHAAGIRIQGAVFVHFADAVKKDRGVAFITDLVVTVGASTIAHNLATWCRRDLASRKWNLVHTLEIFFAQIV